MFRPVKIRQYLTAMKSRGISTTAVLAGSGLTLERLYDPALLIDMESGRTIIANMVELTGNPAIGLEIGNQTELVDFGIISYAMMSAPTARDALLSWIRYSDALVGILVDLRLEELAADHWSVVISERVPLGSAYRFCVDEQIAMLTKLSGAIVGSQAKVWQLELAYPDPGHRHLYAGFFSGPVRFGAAHTRIGLSHPRLDQVLRGSDIEHHELCLHQCKLLAAQIRTDSPMLSRVRAQLMSTRGPLPGLEEMARRLNTTTRTLRRHLKHEGLGYREVIDEFRVAAARAQLALPLNSTKEVAVRLGFRDINSFRRAFKVWTGYTVEAYRARYGVIAQTVPRPLSSSKPAAETRTSSFC